MQAATHIAALFCYSIFLLCTSAALLCCAVHSIPCAVLCCGVAQAQPENGVVNRSTEIFSDGQPLPDLSKLHMLPIYETLPNSEKNITPAQLFERYFAPYLEGRGQLFKKSRRSHGSSQPLLW